MYTLTKAMNEEKHTQKPTKNAWSIAFVLARLFQPLALSCLIWMWIDPQIETIYAKTHMIFAGITAIPFLLTYFRYLNEP